MNKDATQDFLQYLPQIVPGEEFWFACHPGVRCFNACCSDLNMPLTPYDILRLQTALEMDSDSFFEEFVDIDCAPDTGFPVMRLRMADDPGKPCPFLTTSGCGVYQHRSSACRTYPLGRATQVEDPKNPQHSKMLEKFFLVREEHCQGFAEQKSWWIDTWLADQGLMPYVRMNDLYARLLGIYRFHAKGVKLSGKHATMALLCLYQMDRFSDFIKGTGLLERVEPAGQWKTLDQNRFKEKVHADPELRLEFGMQWLELILFGQAKHISPARRSK